MKTRSSNPAPNVLLAIAALLLAAATSCSDTQSGGGGGDTGQSAGDNACQQGTAGCSEAPLENGQAYAEILFGSQQVDANSGSAPFPGDPDVATILISAFEDTYDCSTNQPDDEFGDVRCAAYSMGSFLQGDVGEYLCFQYTQGSSGRSAPITMRVTSDDAGGFNVETAWGWCVCGQAAEECNGSTRGDGTRDACCTVDEDCDSNRCCTPEESCFADLDDRWTCRSPQ